MYQSIDEYIKHFDENTQKRLIELRQFIIQLVPEASEKISYQMPTFYLNGNLVHFAAQKSHIGFYPGGDCIHLFVHQLGELKHSKGTIQIPYHIEMPWDLLKQIILYRRTENLNLKKK
ncbi:MAG: DUF1801 domain-containing protein [Acholeplasmataceae bacterium]|jgi:uncharacterized protein YdhG (YjbR/CyaY superfamily)|nr:DUF1801 domain-containing protein [Acholeplasmataceae bacterium]